MERDNEEIFENLQEILSKLPDHYQILEETIDVDVQKAYFELGQSITIDPEQDQPGRLIQQLNNPGSSLHEVKIILQKLAAIDSVEAFRAIEAYNQQPHPKLRSWAILALQQSKMLMHSSLLDEQQVFISTGLGGKDDKLRYLLIFPYTQIEEGISLMPLQKKSLKNELTYFLSGHRGEVEKVQFSDRFATAMVLLPLQAPIPDIVGNILTECNQYGNFLSEDVLITNMKKFTKKEISELIARHEQKN
ncbi:MAG TPA: hypothetical protein PLK12_17910 [Prolixibacteraceae bacterium]|nr:hypothetical protein [Prolixibacteraceae bacterium]